MRMRHCAMCPVRLYNISPRYLINEIISKKNVIEQKICILIFFTNFVCNIFRYKKTERDMTKKLYCFFLSDFSETLYFSKDFRKTFKYQISWQSVQWDQSCSMRTNVQT